MVGRGRVMDALLVLFIFAGGLGLIRQLGEELVDWFLSADKEEEE